MKAKDLIMKRELVAYLLEEKGVKFSSKGKIPRREKTDDLPLSYAQQRLFFLEQLEGSGPTYNISMPVRIQGHLNIAALEQAINEIVRRHEVLRASFGSLMGHAVQIISPELHLPLPLTDLSTLPAEDKDEELLRLIRQDAASPFDLSTGPLLRTSLLRLGADDFALLLTMHHIVSDGWSSAILLRELGQLYRAFAEGHLSPLPDLPIQYADFAVWQKQWLVGDVLEAQLDYWRQHLAGAPTLLELPTDRPRPAVRSFSGAKESIFLSASLSNALRALSKSEDATLFMTLLAAFKTLLWRYTGQADIVVGTPIAGRNRAEVEPLIGFFINTLALRTRVEGTESFRQLLKQVREVCLGAYANQDLPFEKLVEELQPARSLSHTPLFQVMFTLQQGTGSSIALSDLSLSPLEIDNDTEKFDLTLFVDETEEQMHVVFGYNTELFAEESIRLLLDHFHHLLEAILANPRQRLSRLPLLPEPQRRLILHDWNHTACDWLHSPDHDNLLSPDHSLDYSLSASQEQLPPSPLAEQPPHWSQLLTLPQLFERQVWRSPDATALCFADHHLSYQQVNERANQLAHHLLSLGVQPDSQVGVMMERSIELVVSLLAILKAGAAYVPFDPSYPQARLSFMLEDAGVSVLLTQAHLQERLSGSPSVTKVTEAATAATAAATLAAVTAAVTETAAATTAETPGPLATAGALTTALSDTISTTALATMPGAAPAAPIAPAAVQILAIDTLSELLATESALNPQVPLSGSHLAYMIYTSGSTGNPKGALNTHQAIVNRLLWMQHRYHLTASDVVLQKTPFSFDVSVWEFFWPLLTGARLVVARPDGHRDTSYLLETIEREQVSTIHFVPAMLQAFLADPDVAHSCSSLQRIICSGEALGAELAARCLQQLPQAELHNLYGPTEAAVDVTSWQCRPEDESASVPIGKPISNLSIYILDGELQPVPVGVSGELYIGGVGLARGYHRRAGLTAEKFIPDPYSERGGERLYRTGDIARYRRDGEIEYVGRADQQVKLRGFRIELGEIEAVLRAHEEVVEAVVLARADARGEKRLVGYVKVEGGGAEVETEELRQYLKARVPEYMVPGALMVVKEWPLTPSGKVDRARLPEPAGGRRQTRTELVAPRSEEEVVLAGVWREVLGLEEVGVHDNYFALGGDSIRSLQVVALARHRGLRFNLQQLFQYQTIAELVAVAQSNNGDAPPGTESHAHSEPFGLIGREDYEKLPEGVEDAYPLTMLQAGMLYHMALTPETPLYHNVNSMKLRSALNLDALSESARMVVARHAALRTGFELSRYSEPLQLVYKLAEMDIGVEDISGLSEEEQGRAIDEFIEAEKRRGFDVSRPPLMRFHIHRYGPDIFQFTLTECHPIQDGWSLHTVLAEMFSHYFALVNGEEPPVLEPISVSYRDYVRMERESLESEEHREYWRQKLQDSTVLELPRWRSAQRASQQSQNENDAPDVRFHQVRIPPELSVELKDFARTLAVPIKSVVLAAHMKVLSILTGQTDILTGVVTNGRSEEVGGELTVGLFLNTLPFRQQLTGGTWSELVRATFDSEWELLPYRRYPMAALQHSRGGQQLYETAFNFIHFHVVDSVIRSGNVDVLETKSSEGTNWTLQAHFSLGLDALHLELQLEYNSLELCAEQMEAIEGYYLSVLRAMARDPLAHHEYQSFLSTAEDQRLYVLNEQMQMMPLGVSGEIYVGGAGVGRGYVGDGVATAQRFVPDPYGGIAGGRLYRTGDVGRMREDRELEYVGRVDYQVKVRGYRIELGEIEAALREQAGVGEAVVVLRAERGAGASAGATIAAGAGGVGGAAEGRLVGYVVAAAAAAAGEGSGENPGRLDIRELRLGLEGRLPEYMMPQALMVLERMPLTANGKIDRRALPAPDGWSIDQGVEFVAPRTELEQQIAGIWREVLDVEKVGLHDNFFDLGGHSIRMIEASGKLKLALNRELSVIDMFRHPTISAMAEFLGAQPTGEIEFAENVERAGARRANMKRQREVRKKTRV